jgi:purine catabolism regulator
MPIDGVPVGEMLDHVADAIVLAGHAGLGKPASEAVPFDPDGPQQVEARNVAVLYWRRDRHGRLPSLPRLIERLARAQVAAAVVVPAEASSHVSRAAIAAADDAGLPLVLIHGGQDPAATYHSVFGAMRKVRTVHVARASDMYVRLVRTLHGDAASAQIVAALATGFGVSAALLDNAGTMLAASDDTAREAFRSGFEHPTDVAVRYLGVARDGRYVGKLALLGQLQLSEVDESVLDAAVALLALTIDTLQEPVPNGDIERTILSDLLDSDPAVRMGARRRADRLGHFAGNGQRLLVVIAERTDTESLKRLAAQLETEMRPYTATSIIVVHGESIACLLDRTADIDSIARVVDRRLARPVALGTAAPVAGTDDVVRAHRQAERAAAVAQLKGTRGRVQHYDELGVYRLLFLVPDEDRRHFVREVLGPLAGEQASAAEARRTLRTMLATNGNVAETARRLFIHYNTLRHRLERLENQLGPVFSDAELRLAVQTALTLHDLESPLSPVGNGRPGGR